MKSSDLLNEIQIKYSMVKKMKNHFRIMTSILIICILLCVWGFGNIQDPLLTNISELTRTIISWISLVLAILSTIILLFLYPIYKESKKHVLNLIDNLDEKARKQYRKRG